MSYRHACSDVVACHDAHRLRDDAPRSYRGSSGFGTLQVSPHVAQRTYSSGGVRVTTSGSCPQCWHGWITARRSRRSLMGVRFAMRDLKVEANQVSDLFASVRTVPAHRAPHPWLMRCCSGERRRRLGRTAGAARRQRTRILTSPDHALLRTMSYSSPTVPVFS